MLDIFKGIAVTAITWLLVVRWLAGLGPGFWALPIASFALPIFMPNRRWLLGNGIVCGGALVIVAKHQDSTGGALVLAMLAFSAIATALGVAARWVIRRSRTWYRARTGAPPLRKQELKPISVGSLALTACAVLGLLAIYSLYVMHSARSSAQQIAGSRPYCVQVPTRDNYRSVTSLFDLLGFRMKGGGHLRHALLAVRNGNGLDLYHWSYFSDTFVQDPYVERPIFCDLISDFLAHPRRYRQEAASSLNFQMQGLSFSIPLTYAPAVSTTGRIEIASPSAGAVEIIVRREGMDSARREKAGTGLLVQSLGEEHGLIKERVQDAELKYPSELQLYELDAAGREKTLVKCLDSPNANCLHEFSDERFRYSFHHPASGLSDWQQIQRALSETVATFVDGDGY